MPCVRSPSRWLRALRTGVHPCIHRVGRSARVDGVIPGPGVSIALHAIDHSIAVCEHLIHIHFDIGGCGGIGDPHIRLIQKVRSSGIGAEDRVEDLAARAGVVDGVLPRKTAERRSTDDLTGASCASGSARIGIPCPGGEGLDVLGYCCIGWRRLRGRRDSDVEIGRIRCSARPPALYVKCVLPAGGDDGSGKRCGFDRSGAVVDRIPHRDSGFRTAGHSAGRERER